MKMLLLVATLLSAMLAFAEGQSGNGGDVLTCPPEVPEKPIELLDFYEARDRGINYDLGGPELSVRQKLDIYWKRLARVAPRRAALYATLAEDLLVDIEAFEADPEPRSLFVAKFVAKELADKPDSNHLTYPLGCKIEQLVIRQKPLFDEDRLYTINARLWMHPQFDNDNKAAAIVHEVVYGEAVDFYKHTDSVMSRYFNTRLSAAAADEFDLKSFTQLLAKTNLGPTEFDGLRLDSLLIMFYPNRQLASGVLAEDQWYKNFADKLPKDTEVEFYDSGNTKRILIPNTIPNYFNRHVIVNIDGKDHQARDVWFYPSGKLRQISTNGGWFFSEQFVFENHKRTFSHVMFSPKGEVIGGTGFSGLTHALRGYGGEVLQPQSVLDGYLNRFQLHQNELAYFRKPTYKGVPLLATQLPWTRWSARHSDLDSKTDQANELCKKMGYLHSVGVASKGMDGGKFYYTNKSNQLVEGSTGNGHFWNGYHDPMVISELYCEGHMTSDFH